MPKVTILVAIYNAERYLAQCLDSLCQQTLRDIQIVCIDDCSTDRSPQILREYAARDNRIVCLRTPVNSGQAVARNLGLTVAAGTFTTMLDSDDWLSTDALEQAVGAFDDDTDAVLFRLMMYDDGKKQAIDYENRTTQRVFSGNEAFELSLTWRIHGLYVVRTDLHKRYPYDTTCKLYSDDNTTRMHFLHARKVKMCDGQYFYRQHADSSTKACSMRRFDYMEANWSMTRQLKREIGEGNVSDADRIMRLYETHRWENLVGIYGYLWKHRHQFSSEERQIVLERMRNMLNTFSPRLISRRLRYKPGFWYIHDFALFRLQLRVYFTLKKWLFNRTVND